MINLFIYFIDFFISISYLIFLKELIEMKDFCKISIISLSLILHIFLPFNIVICILKIILLFVSLYFIN